MSRMGLGRRTPSDPDAPRHSWRSRGCWARPTKV
ncbi:hypothetical protein CKAH01_00686 [Colletotrichum kahawae]|uniref:Uncharacterized protein n=1 Tax=Colletotrichum kahawae TaxID=34407 RepID=A0AAD9YKC5_COLKA|nr:hypothetical protein CKAH01_00686 [Colletotrichum kahawae]